MASTEDSNIAAQLIDIFTTSHRYKGVHLLGVQPPEIFEALQQWETREDDIYLVSYPKSGTHWIFEIVSLIVNDADAEKIDRTHMVCSLDEVQAPTVESLGKVTPGYETMKGWKSPRVMPSHLLEELAPDQIKRSKVVVLSRNPKDVFVSYYKFIGHTLAKEMGGWRGFMRFFLSEDMWAGSWFRYVKGWWAHKDDPNVLLCKYEDFQKDLRGSIKRISEFLDHPLTDAKLDKAVELSTMKGMLRTYQEIDDTMGDQGKQITKLFGQLPFLRKGTVGGWKKEFTVADSEYFDEIYKQNMDGTGIDFVFEL